MGPPLPTPVHDPANDLWGYWPSRETEHNTLGAWRGGGQPTAFAAKRWVAAGGRFRQLQRCRQGWRRSRGGGVGFGINNINNKKLRKILSPLQTHSAFFAIVLQFPQFSYNFPEIFSEKSLKSPPPQCEIAYTSDYPECKESHPSENCHTILAVHRAGHCRSQTCQFPKGNVWEYTLFKLACPSKKKSLCTKVIEINSGCGGSGGVRPEVGME